MDADISDQIAGLNGLSRQQLLDLWRKVYKKPAPQSLRRELLVPFIAYRMQENFYGGLKPAIRADLRSIARGADKPKDHVAIVRPRMRPGTRLHREWRGHTHEVVVTAEGFEYAGAKLRSLSEIARKITGTRWSGPAFFRLGKARQGGNRE